MKKHIIICTVIAITIALTSILYAMIKQPPEVETVTLAQLYFNPYPDEMPKVVLDPMCGYPLY